MMVQALNLVCGATVGKKKVSSSRAKLSFAAWVFIFWVCLKSIYVMYKLVNDTEASIAAEELKQVRTFSCHDPNAFAERTLPSHTSFLPSCLATFFRL